MNLLLHIAIYIAGMSLFVSSEELQKDSETYKHPDFDMQITGSAGWNTLDIESDLRAYEVINRNNNMHISMWYSETEIDPKIFLEQFANEQGYICTKGPNDTVLNEYHAFYVTAVCVSEKTPVRLYMAAIQDETGLFMFQVKCPEECYQVHQDLVIQVLGSLRVGI